MGHFDGRLEESVDIIIDKAMSKPNGDGVPGYSTQGAFYNIFKKHAFFDVADPNNQLTVEQRAQVPLHAQYRYSNFANAIAEMFQYFFTDKEVGLLNTLDNVVLKLDAAAGMASASTKALGQNMVLAGLFTPPPGSPNPVLQYSNEIMKIKEYLAGLSFGVPPYDIDVLLPTFPDFDYDLDLSVFGNLYPPGFIPPDWNFLYEYEYKKSSKFYEDGEKDSGLKIGCNIDVGNLGPPANTETNLIKIFDVVIVSQDDGVKKTPKLGGNIVGGVSAEKFKIIQAASKLSKDPTKEARDVVNVIHKEVPAASGKQAKPAVYALQDGEVPDTGISYDDIRKFTLTPMQLRCSFYNLIEMKLWNVIKNKSEWARGHWGALINNALPGYVRTAVCSYVWSKGLAIDPVKSAEAGLVSYLLTMGLYYKVGRQYPVRLMAIPEVDAVWLSGKLRSPKSGPLPAGDITVDKIPKNGEIANLYWQWMADIIVRSTNDSAGEEIALHTRKRRVAEANLIYRNIPGGVAYEMGGILPKYHTETGLIERKFDKLLAVLSEHSFYRYGNTGSMGAEGKQLLPKPPMAILKYAKGDKDRLKLEGVGNGKVVEILRHLLDRSYVKEATITRVAVDSAGQASAMYDNLQKPNPISYASAGRTVEAVYRKEKARLGIDPSKPIPAQHAKAVQEAMTRQIESIGPNKVSAHCGPFDPIAVVDIGPNSVKYYDDAFTENNGKSKQAIGHGHLINTFWKANIYEPKLVHNFLFPNDYAVYAQQKVNNDPAFHIEIDKNTVFDTSLNNKLPNIEFKFKSKIFENEEGRRSPFAGDSIKKTRSKTEEAT